MQNRKLIIISNDALVREDMEYLKTKPCIKKLIEGGSFVESLKSVYPTITYCCHTSMITGAYPNKTGVYNNIVDELNSRDWQWQSLLVSLSINLVSCLSRWDIASLCQLS